MKKNNYGKIKLQEILRKEARKNAASKRKEK